MSLRTTLAETVQVCNNFTSRKRMKILIFLVTSCMIAVSLAGPFKEAKLEHVLEDLEVVLQDLKEDNAQAEEYMHGKNSKEDELEEVLWKMDEPNTDMFTPAMEEMLLYTADIEAAATEVKAAGGHVSIQLGHDLLIAQIPSDFVAKQNSFASSSANIPNSASPETLSHTKAYWKYREVKLQSQSEVQSRMDIEETLSTPMDFELPRSQLLSDDASSPFRQTMTGKIVVFAIAVSGPDEVAMSDPEKETMESNFIRGLKVWTDEAPESAELSFVFVVEKVSITVPNSEICYSQYGCHIVFADPVLKKLGYDRGLADEVQVARYYKSKFNADGAFIAFVTKYRLKNFAYASYGHGPVFSGYTDYSWGALLFAHEVGHVFNAPDEYGNCECTTKLWGKGTCNALNVNCASSGCTPPSHADSCVMRLRELKVCEYTKKHVGWC